MYYNIDIETNKVSSKNKRKCWFNMNSSEFPFCFKGIFSFSSDAWPLSINGLTRSKRYLFVFTFTETHVRRLSGIKSSLTTDFRINCLFHYSKKKKKILYYPLIKRNSSLSNPSTLETQKPEVFTAVSQLCPVGHQLPGTWCWFPSDYHCVLPIWR